MSTPQPLIVGLGGTLRGKSYSRAALREALRIAAENGAHTELLDLRELNLPMFTPNIDLDDYPISHRASIARLLDTLRRADALIWSSATYHGTITGVLKNALDFVELMADDESPYLLGRAVGFMAVSDAMPFGAMANAASELRAWVAPTQVALSQRDDFHDDLTLKGERATRRVTRLINELMEFARQRMKAEG